MSCLKTPFTYYSISGSGVSMFWSRAFRCQIDNLKGAVHMKITFLTSFTHHVIPKMWNKKGDVGQSVRHSQTQLPLLSYHVFPHAIKENSESLSVFKIQTSTFVFHGRKPHNTRVSK